MFAGALQAFSGNTLTQKYLKEDNKNLRAYITTGPKPVIPAYRCAKYGYCVRTMQLTAVCG